MSVFPQIIDAIGGITVNNPYDYVQENWVFPEGPLQLDGESAIMFCRMRSQDGDDGRVMRQHLVLQGILARLQEPSMLPRVPELITSLSDVVRTTIPADVQTRLIAMLPALSRDDLAFTNIDYLLWADYAPNGAWIHQGDWSTLPGYVEG